MGYANRVLRIDFPDLTEPGDTPIHLVIKNPRVMPPSEITPGDVPTGPDGQPDEQAAMQEMYRIISRLVKAWHVYDATDDGDDQARLPLPATPELVARLPLEIVNAVATKIQEVSNPS